MPSAPASTAAAASAAFPMLPTTSTRCPSVKDGRFVTRRIFLVSAIRRYRPESAWQTRCLPRSARCRVYQRNHPGYRSAGVHFQDCRAGAHDAGNVERPRDDSRVRGRTAGGGAKARGCASDRVGRCPRESESSATRITGSSGKRGAPCSAPASRRKNALADVVQVRSSLGEPLVLDLL